MTRKHTKNPSLDDLQNILKIVLLFVIQVCKI
jgi:hypothetical protein